METLSAFGLAFLAGLLSFFSPCVLPLIPVYVSIISGLTVEELRDGNKSGNKSNILVSIILFVLGFSIVYALLGATAFAIGRIILDYSGLISKIAGIALIGFGLVLLAGKKIRLFSSLQSRGLAKRTESVFFPLMMGTGIAVGWIPCNAPLLTSALSAAAIAKSPFGGLAVSFVYSLGLGIPFVISGLALGKFLTLFVKYKKYIPVVTAISGVFLVVCGILMMAGGMQLFRRLIINF